MRSDTVCVCVFVWADGTRSQLPTSSLWQNRLCVKRHLLSPKSSVFQWACGFAFRVRDRGVSRELKRQMKGTNNWLNDKQKKSVGRFMVEIKMVASNLQRPSTFYGLHSPWKAWWGHVLFSTTRWEPSRQIYWKRPVSLILPRDKNNLFPSFSLVMDSHWRISPFSVRLMLRSRSSAESFSFSLRTVFYLLFPNY